MKNRNVLALVLLTALGLQACHNSNKENIGASTTTMAADSTLDTLSDVAKDKDTKLSDGQTDFVTKAALGSTLEVDAGNLVLQRTKNPDVKQFAQMMVTDHTKGGKELEAIARTKGLGLPSTATVEQKGQIDALKGLSGDGFDRHYMQMMVADHTEDLEEFRKAQSLADADLSAFAKKMVPMLEMHYKKAVEISTRLEKQKVNNGDDILNISPTKKENKKPNQ